MERILSAELQDRREFNASLVASLGKLRDVSSHLCGWNKALLNKLQRKKHQLSDTEKRVQDYRAAEGRRKDKANIVCLVTRSRVARAAKVAQAVMGETARLQEQWNDAVALRIHVASQARQAGEQTRRRWEEQTVDLGFLYVRSLQDNYIMFAQ
ncbi:hypothetical protein CGRA01v4_15093 [Colletotrichum graminicola]|nr:hypothetical protein CGRA01v4_15093 [Colletotrichum graminicola]